MSLFDLFTGAASKTAAKNNLQAISIGQQQAGNALQDSAKAGLSYLFGGPDSGGALQALDSGYGQARSDLGSQYTQTQGLLGQLGSLYQPLTQGGQDAYEKYLDATGANGAEGSARASAAFQASPGYNYSMDQALGAVQRSAAARGGLAGGNATADILKTATGLADQGFNAYISNLGNAAQGYTQGLAGQAQGLTAQAGASQTYGSQLGALGTGRGSAIAGVYGQGAGIQAGLGQGVSNLVQNTTNALTSNNNQLAASKNAAGANVLGALVGLGQLGAGGAGSAAGGGAGGGSFLANLFK